MRTGALVLGPLLLLVAAVPPSYARDPIVKELITSGGRTRAYYLFVPEPAPTAPAPLLVVLHGSGHNGRLLVEKWKDSAAKQSIIVVGPDSLNAASWTSPVDGPDFLHDLVETLKSKHSIDSRRVYLFGHSAGASFGLQLALLESEYFAAAAVHAGALPQQAYPLIEHAARKTPIAIWVGADDPLFPLPAVRATRDELVKRSFPVELTEIPRHDHNYYIMADKVNAAAWAFLKQHELAAEPRYEQYTFR